MTTGRSMTKLHLVIGNKNYSSWSLRVWLAMTAAGLQFDETIIPLDQPDTASRIAGHSGAGRVPVLHHGNLVIWESLAILEYLAETFPDKHWWPRSHVARSVARSVSSEMHAGFLAFRSACPMNLRRPPRKVSLDAQANGDVARIEEIWRQCRSRFGGKGRFLFGRFCNADAMFAPIVARFETYEIPVAQDTRAYMTAISSMPAFRRWKAAALAETWVAHSNEVQ
jgi:glutathione S-transferase